MKSTTFQKILKFIIFLIFPIAGFSQDSIKKIENDLVDNFNKIRTSGKAIITRDYSFDSSNERYFYVVLKKYYNDSSSHIRFLSRQLIIKNVIKSHDSLLKQAVVADLIDDISSSESSTSSFPYLVLDKFMDSDFSDSTRHKMVSMFDQVRDRRKYLLLCGRLNIQELLPKVRVLAQKLDSSKRNWWNTEAFYASLALTRLGNNEKISILISATESIKDTILVVTKLLEYLAYTKNPASFQFLQKYLDVNTAKLSGGRDFVGYEVNQYAAAYLAEYMDNFPLKKEDAPYSQKDIEIARAFMRQKFGN